MGLPSLVRQIRHLSNRKWAVLLGAGMALFPLHNVWLTEMATNSKGEVVFFLPTFGALVWIMAALLYCAENYRMLGWGDRRVWIPLLVIVGAMGLSGLPEGTLGQKLAPLFTGVSLFAVYLASRRLGKDVFLPLAVGAAVASVGILAHRAVVPGGYSGWTTGGYIFEANFDIATGYILLGAALYFGKWRWQLAGLSVVALLVSASPEALFVLGVLGLVVLGRRDWPERKLVVGGVVTAGVVVLVIIMLTGLGGRLYSYALDAATGEKIANYVNQDGEVDPKSPLEMRWLVIRDSFAEFEPLGEGYNLTEFSVRTVHNVPLVIVQQLGWPGILAGLAWLWVAVWCLAKTRWKYVWVGIIALGVFDHFVWTQMAPIFWATVGASMVNSEPDRLFRRAA